MGKTRRRFVYFTLGMVMAFGLAMGEETIQTPGEAVHYVAYTQHQALTKFISRLEQMSPYLKVKTAGRSLPTEEYGPKDLYLCIMTEEGISFPDELNRKKPTFYIVASKHGNEQSA